ncbi:A1S_2505 family phage non-structural protein [Thioalkalivibrio thiocyanodenitrificans]|uniref:A1S_2505 family phage non-structural protein n=1 Tax=Thioalkalivibrio thiocyanodenitrificans TaxID=243063 RepID=UPI0006878730|nr:DUF4326 domain-containing protein [Thioalkalivibrio thiocyanodenitrificans]
MRDTQQKDFLDPHSSTRVVNVRDEKADVYIGRGSAYGNPFLVQRYGRDGCIAQFRAWIREQPELLRHVRETLPGKSLGCHCAPQACHGDVLKEIADGLWDARIPPEPVFVFGSNEAGRHGAGAARFAQTTRGAEPGVGVGPTGSAYALPTKDKQIETLELDAVRRYVQSFLAHARAHPDQLFQVTRIGCGLAGFDDAQIAPLFKERSANVLLPGIWLALENPRLARVVVAGSRGFEDYRLLEERLTRILDGLAQSGASIEIVSGGAKGADTLGERFALEHGYPIRRMPAPWHRYGKRAGMIRNQLMSWYATHLVAFWDGVSPGTKMMVDTAGQDKIKTRVVRANPLERG